MTFPTHSELESAISSGDNAKVYSWYTSLSHPSNIADKKERHRCNGIWERILNYVTQKVKDGHKFH